MVALLITLLSTRKSEGDAGKKGKEHEESMRHCPICGSPLAKGEKVKSVLYPGKIDRMMEIYGCPHCYPSSGSVPRICPVCKRTLSPDALIYARYFERDNGAHVHVLGCTQCYTRRR